MIKRNANDSHTLHTSRCVGCEKRGCVGCENVIWIHDKRNANQWRLWAGGVGCEHRDALEFGYVGCETRDALESGCVGCEKRDTIECGV